MARATLARTFQGRFDKIVVPCVVASGDIQDRKGTEPLSFRCGAWPGRGGRSKVPLPRLLPTQTQVRRARARAWGRTGGRDTGPSAPCLPTSPHNTLFLELWCPAVAPSIIVVSDKGNTISNFGDVAVGESSLGPAPPHPQEPGPWTHLPPMAPGLGAVTGPVSGHRSSKKVSIQNISSEDMSVSLSTLCTGLRGWMGVGWGGWGWVGGCTRLWPPLTLTLRWTSLS